jgi:hypothetical protein
MKQKQELRTKKGVFVLSAFIRVHLRPIKILENSPGPISEHPKELLAADEHG